MGRVAARQGAGGSPAVRRRGVERARADRGRRARRRSGAGRRRSSRRRRPWPSEAGRPTATTTPAAAPAAADAGAPPGAAAAGARAGARSPSRAAAEPEPEPDAGARAAAAGARARRRSPSPRRRSPPPPEPEPPPRRAPRPTRRRETPVTAQEPLAATVPPAAAEWTATVGLRPSRRAAAGHGRRRVELAAVAALVVACGRGVRSCCGGGRPADARPGAQRPSPSRAVAYQLRRRRAPAAGRRRCRTPARAQVVVLRPELQQISTGGAPPPGAAAPATGEPQYGASVASGDFDGDGSADLAVGAPRRRARRQCSTARPTGLEDARRRDAARRRRSLRRGARGRRPRRRRPRRPRDRRPRARATPAGGCRSSPARRTGSATPPARSTRPTTPPPASAPRARLGDVNGDGSLDIVEAGAAGRSEEAHTTFCPGSANGPQACAIVNADGGTALAVGDVDGDGAGRRRPGRRRPGPRGWSPARSAS